MLICIGIVGRKTAIPPLLKAYKRREEIPEKVTTFGERLKRFRAAADA